MHVTIRRATTDDAEALRHYLAALTSERLPTLFERTRAPTSDEERAYLADLGRTPGSFALVAVTAGGDVVGMLDVHRHERPQMAHGAAFGMSVAAEARNQGIGSRLLTAMLDELQREGMVHRIELEVFATNPAIRLYERFGFEVEGRRRGAVVVDGEATDLVLMARTVGGTLRNGTRPGGANDRAPATAARARPAERSPVRDDRDVIRWRLHLAAPPSRVYWFLASDEGRASYWAERAVEVDGAIDFEFVNGTVATAPITIREPGHRFGLTYFGARVVFELEATDEGGTDLTLVTDGFSSDDREALYAGWLNVLLPLKAAVDHGIDLRNHDPSRTWDEGWVDQ